MTDEELLDSMKEFRKEAEKIKKQKIMAFLATLGKGKTNVKTNMSKNLTKKDKFFCISAVIRTIINHGDADIIEAVLLDYYNENMGAFEKSAMREMMMETLEKHSMGMPNVELLDIGSEGVQIKGVKIPMAMVQQKMEEQEEENYKKELARAEEHNRKIWEEMGYKFDKNGKCISTPYDK